MMNKHTQVLVDAGLPVAPPVSTFIEGLKEFVHDKEMPGPDPEDGMFGDAFANSKNDRKPPGTEKARMLAIAAALEFEAVRISKGVELTKLDDWLVAFAKFTMDPEAMIDEEEKQKELKERRVELCGELAKPKSWSPSTLRTYVNALATAWKSLGHGDTIVPYSEKQFPRFTLFMSSCITRFKNKIKYMTNP